MNLEVALRNIQIKIDSRISEEIINRKKGVVLRILFSIKMYLEKNGIIQENQKGCNILFISASKISNLQSSLIFDTKKSKLDDKYNKNEIQVNQASPLRSYNKYDQFRLDQQNLINSDINYEAKDNNKIKKANHDDFKSLVTKQNAELIEFDSNNHSNWQKNVNQKIALDKKHEKLQLQEAEKYQIWLQNVLKITNKENTNKIDYFEKNLSNLGLDINDDKLKKIPNKPMMNSEITMQKIKKKIVTNQISKKEKQENLRKMTVDHIKNHSEIEKNKDKSIISNKSLDRISSNAMINGSNKKIFTPEKVNEIEKIIDERDIIELSFSPKNFYEKEAFLKEVHKLDYKKLEMEIADKVQRRLIDNNFCRDIVDLILHITDDTYKYQLLGKSESIESAMWKEWMEIFIYNHKNVEDNLNLNVNLSNKALDKSVQNSLSFGPTSNESFEMGNDGNYNLEDCELMDYINFIGQWSPEIIPSTAFVNVDLNEILNDNFGQTEKTNKNGKKMRLTESIYSVKREEGILIIILDPDNLIIPKQPVKNPYFGDIIEMLIDLKFIEKSEKSKNFLQYIPIKLSIIGHSFGGKRTQAKMICDTYPFKHYNIEELVNKSLEILEKLETPLEANPKFKTMKKNQIDQLQDDKNKEEIKYAEIKKLAIIIRETRKNNKDQNLDEVYVNLLLEFMKFDFHAKTESQILEEITQKHKRRKEIIEELNKMKEELNNKKAKPKVKEEQQLTQELTKINLESNKGIVISDFPQTINQAKVLENKLTNYFPEINKPKPLSQIYRENLLLLLERSKKQPIQKELIQGGLDFIINLDVDSQSCVKRSVLRRVDPNNGNIYHLEDNPPPNDNKVIDRLKIIDDPASSEASLKIKHSNFDLEIYKLNEFYLPFGVPEHNFHILNKVNGQRTKDSVFTSINETITKFIKITDEKETFMIESKTHHMEEINPISSVNQNNLTSYNQSLNLNISLDHNKDINNVLSDQNNEVLSSTHNFILISIDELKKKLPLEIRENLFKTFFKTFETYSNECKQIFKFFRKQNDFIINGYYKIQQRFLDYLRRKNQKQQIVLDYSIKYNKFIEDYIDLKDDIQLKEEHMHNIDDLGDKIWEIIDIRKTEAIEERKKIISQGWIENELEKSFINITKLFQCEIDRFLSFLMILRDYYYTLDNRPLISLPNTWEINKEDIESCPIESTENENIFPRLEKLYKFALKVQFMWDDKLNKDEEKEKLSQNDKDSKINKKSSTPNIKKTTSDKQVFFVEKRELLKYDEDFKAILMKEKAKYRFRITLIKHWSKNRLNSFRKIANHTFEKLDNWIISSIKAENEALNKLVLLI